MATPMDASRPAVAIEQWIAEARGGSPTALDWLFGACCARLLAAANRGLSAALRRRLDPGDVVQDTLMEAWKDFPHFRGKNEADLLAWLWQILRHNLANERRRHIDSARRSTRREVSLGEGASARMQNDGDRNTQSPEVGIEHRERHEALEFSLRRLPEHYRLALCLHTQEGLTFIEVGGRLRCSAGAARKLWGRAAEELVRLLGDDWNP